MGVGIEGKGKRRRGKRGQEIWEEEGKGRNEEEREEGRRKREA